MWRLDGNKRVILRYSMLVNHGAIEKLFVDPGFKDNPAGVPVDVSSAEGILSYLKSR